MIQFFTSNPEHDAAMHDILAAQEEPDYTDYPVCDICGEHITPGQRYTELGEEVYIHKSCMKYIRWRAMDDKGIF